VHFEVFHDPLEVPRAGRAEAMAALPRVRDASSTRAQRAVQLVQLHDVWASPEEES
jgi:predicted LPLAT superfamily acyltransferase